MNSWRVAAVAEFRSARKCFSISGRLCLMVALMLLVTQVHCRPSDEEVLAGGDEYADVDNVEWHHVKIVDGVMREDHPVIMYKEDFVSEDYDPAKNRTSLAATNTTDSSTSGAAAPRPQRKYKDIAHRRRRLNRTDTEQYRALKPEKMYFDVLPQAPLVVVDDSGADSSKFDSSKIRVDVISLIDNDNNDQVDTKAKDDNEEPSKQLLTKRPKKFHSRQRRDTQTDGVHVVRKRNPFIRAQQTDVRNDNRIDVVLSLHRQTPAKSFEKHVVPGNLWNDPYSPVVYFPASVTEVKVPVGFPNRATFPGQSVPVWGSRPREATRAPNTVQWTTPSLLHDANPNNADFSFMNVGPTSRPAKTRTTPPLFHNAAPEFADFSGFTGAQVGRDSSAVPSTLGQPQWSRSALSGQAAGAQVGRDSSAVASTLVRPQWSRSALSGQAELPIYSPPRIQQYGRNCAKAIDSCCGDKIDDVRYNCFQSVGCERTLMEIVDFCPN